MTISDASFSPIDRIRKALLRFSGSNRTGAQLRAIIDYTCPDFDIRAATSVPIGPGALTKLLNEHFGDIVRHIGKQGGDNLYSIGGTEIPNHPGRIPIASIEEANLWAAFASPGLHQQIVVDRSTTRTFVQTQGSVTSENEVAILPITPDEFRSMAEKFAQTCPPDLNDELQQALDQPQLTYQHWISVLRDRYASQYHRWGLYRVQAIIDLFRKRLEYAGFLDHQREVIVSRLSEAQSAKFKERLLGRTRHALYSHPLTWERPDAPSSGALAAVSADGHNTSAAEARSLATLAIKNMSLTEIRHLRLPLGAIIDAGLLSKK